MLVGDTAGFLNAPKIKGTHCAMKSGMLAAEAVADALANGKPAEPASYEDRFRQSWVYEELKAARNIVPAYSHLGLYGAIAYGAIDAYVLRGKAPWTLPRREPDHAALRPAEKMPRIEYPKPDGVLTFDRLSSVFISNTNHEEDQVPHLQLRDPSRWEPVNWEIYASPESRYCPAGVYEAVETNSGRHRLQINAQNCVHCKTCDIKDPTQNIDWVTPEGGGGPNYPGGM
jgi:electron-transferring-flavoprotein dehydrogenase